MNAEELLQALGEKIASGELRREEVLQKLAIIPPVKASTEPQQPSRFSMTKLLYVLGGTIVVVAIAIFVGQIWEDIGSFFRIAITLGLGLVFALSGSVLLLQKPDNAVGSVFHFMGGILIPGGALVTLSELFASTVSLWQTTITFGVISFFYWLLNLRRTYPVLTFFVIADGTIFIYLLVAAMLQDSYNINSDIYAYLTMMVGLCYLLLSHTFVQSANKQLVGMLHFFGILFLLGAGFSQVFDTGIWEILFFLLVGIGLYISVHMKSKSILVISTLFLIAHITHITGEYFADSLGWPISLMLLGFVFIGLGYGSVSINKKYIQGKE